MHITVVADKSGKIVGLAHDGPGSASARTHATALAAGEGQALHSVELSPELLQRLGAESFADELFQYVVVRKGRKSVLSRAGAKKR